MPTFDKIIIIKMFLQNNTPLSTTIKQTNAITAGNLDRTDSMQTFLKQHKILNELNKGVQAMKSFVYPSILQKQAIVAIKKSESKNIMICYQELTGIKLTVAIPILNALIRQSVQIGFSDNPHSLFCVYLCHSFVRCQEISEHLTELTSFCTNMVEVLNLDSSDLADAMLKIKKSQQTSSDFKSRVLVMTPSLCCKLIEKNAFQNLGDCFSTVLDKVDLLQALDFGSDLKKITTFQPSFRCIFTTTDTRNDKDKPAEEFEEFKEIKRTFMGSEKALIIKLNHDVNQQVSMFEKINHLYVSCDSNLDKFILLFSFIKLAIV